MFFYTTRIQCSQSAQRNYKKIVQTTHFCEKLPIKEQNKMWEIFRKTTIKGGPK